MVPRVILSAWLLMLGGAALDAATPAGDLDDRDRLLHGATAVYGTYRVIRLPITKGVRVLNPIQVSRGPGNRMYAANQSGEVYVLRDTDGDGLEDEAALFCDVATDGLKSPGGFAFRGDTVFIGTRQEIRAYRDSDGDGRADSSWTFFKDFPHSEHPYEWTSGLCFGPDGWLYAALATDSWNAGASPDPKGLRGAVIRISPDGKTSERIATGVRSVYGMAFNRHGDLFFTDNEGGGNPKEELNRLVRGAFYGHNPRKFERKTGDSIEGPVLILESEVAPAGIEFNSDTNDFGGTAGDLFIANYGPGERWNRGGVSRVRITKMADTYRYEEHPVADIPKLSDLAFGPDGALYLAQHGRSDYWYNVTEARTGAFYKIVADPTVKAASPRKEKAAAEPVPASNLEKGRELFVQRACFACHATHDGPEQLGPNLNGLGTRLSRAEILEEIIAPNQRIKPGLAAVKLTRKNGQVLLGRVVNADDGQISVMMIGNGIVSVPRAEVALTEPQAKSLMPERLLNGLSPAETEHLLDYLVSLR